MQKSVFQNLFAATFPTLPISVRPLLYPALRFLSDASFPAFPVRIPHTVFAPAFSRRSRPDYAARCFWSFRHPSLRPAPSIGDGWLALCRMRVCPPSSIGQKQSEECPLHLSGLTIPPLLFTMPFLFPREVGTQQGSSGFRGRIQFSGSSMFPLRSLYRVPVPVPILSRNRPSQPSDHLFYKKNLAPLQVVKVKMK